MEQDLSTITGQLNFRLVCSSIGYMPFRFLSLIKKENDKDLLSLVNKVLIIDKKGAIEEPTTTELFMLIGKPSLLSQNIFDLNNLKQQHNKDNFNYILDKYAVSLDGVIAIAKYYSENIEVDIPKADTNIKSSFKNQYSFFLEHKKEFNSKFRPYSFPKLDSNTWLNQNTLSDFKKTFPNSKLQDLKIEDFKTQPKPSNTDNQDNQKSKSQLKKEKLQAIKDKTNQEVEAFLLQKVFGLKL